MCTKLAIKPKSICHCINLRRASGLVTAFYDRQLAPAGLTINQFSLLINIKRLNSTSVSDLAAKVGLERTTLVRTLKPLLKAGLIEDLSASGSRNRCLQLSGAGHNRLELAMPLWDTAQKIVEEKMGREALTNLEEWLDIFG